MRLLDYATVVVGNGHWMKGWQAEDRMPGLSVEVFDACGVTEEPVLDGTSSGVYEIRSFGIKADLPRSLMCAQEDDDKWLRDAVKLAAEEAVGVAACIEHAEGTETWIGDDDVIPGPGQFNGDNAGIARMTWFNHNVGQPALHLADDQMIKALNDRVIMSVGDQMVTAWGDPVVNSPGYKPKVAFWSGPITVYLSDVDTDMLVNHANNKSIVIANLIAALDMPPGQIVRIGDPPA